MRNLTLWIALTAWAAAGLAAEAEPVAGPLAPGKPAGVRQAQLSNPNTMAFVGLGLLVVGAGIYMAKGTYKIPGTSSATSPSH